MSSPKRAAKTASKNVAKSPAKPVSKPAVRRASAARPAKRPVAVMNGASTEAKQVAAMLDRILADGNLDAVREMLSDPHSVPGLSDGGAHCGIICDASFPTYLLTHWTRDRSRGELLPLEYVVRKQTHDTARLYGLADRGTVDRGMA